MSGAAVIAVKEEKARIGNIQVTKETALVATEEGIVAVERHRIQEHQPIRVQPAPIILVPLPAPPQERIIIQQRGEPEYAWYNPQGKDCCIAFLLILMWILIFAIALPLAIFYCICHIFFGKDD